MPMPAKVAGLGSTSSDSVITVEGQKENLVDHRGGDTVHSQTPNSLAGERCAWGAPYFNPLRLPAGRRSTMAVCQYRGDPGADTVQDGTVSAL